MPRRLFPALLVAAAALALAGCATSTTSTPVTTSSATSGALTTGAASAPASPRPSATPKATAGSTASGVNLPKSCDTLASSEIQASVVGDLTLQGDGTGFTRPTPTGAKLALGCDWAAGDATGVLVLISTATDANVAAAAAKLPADGFTCTTNDAGAPECQKTVKNTQYPVDTVTTVVAQQGVWIYVEATNKDALPLLADLRGYVFGK